MMVVVCVIIHIEVLRSGEIIFCSNTLALLVQKGQEKDLGSTLVAKLCLLCPRPWFQPQHKKSNKSRLIKL